MRGSAAAFDQGSLTGTDAAAVWVSKDITGRSPGADVFSGCGTAVVFGTAGSPAESRCAAHDSCVLAAE